MVQFAQKELDAMNALREHCPGFTEGELQRLVHIASEDVKRSASREKHSRLPKRPKRTPEEWAAYKEHLMSDEHSHHIDISFGLACQALLQDDTEEFRFQLDQLFSSCVRAWPALVNQARDAIAVSNNSPEGA